MPSQFKDLGMPGEGYSGRYLPYAYVRCVTHKQIHLIKAVYQTAVLMIPIQHPHTQTSREGWTSTHLQHIRLMFHITDRSDF